MKEQEVHREVVIKPQEGFQMQFASSCVDVMFGGGNLGGGKGALLDSHIVTPYGLRKVRDIEVGSIISNPDTGGQERVIYLHPISMFPFYRISFSDGTYMDCTEGHLWKARVAGKQSKRRNSDMEKEKYDGWRLMSAIQIYEWIKNKNKGMYKGKNLNIPLPEPVQFTRPITPTTPRPIAPYVLGALIGDGCMGESICDRCIYLCTPDEFIVEKFKSYGYDMSKKYANYIDSCATYVISNNNIVEDIKTLKMNGCTAANKFIPKFYKYSTIEERKELLCGLLDTDGYVDDRGHLSYTTISKKLAEDVAFVVRSLGGRASITSKKAGYKDGDGVFHPCNEAYTIWICTKFNDEIVSLPKKKNRVKKYGYVEIDKDLKLEKTIVSAEYIGMKEGRCISVDNPSGLYMVDDFTVTHNSFALVLALAEPLMADGDFRAVITRRSLQSQKTGGSFVDTFKAIFGDYCSVKTADSPRISFPSGAYCDLTYIDDTNLDKMREQWKGKQIDAICIDEITEISWEAFSYVQTRNRGRSKTFTGKFFATLNPKRSHWTRKFLDWYIGVDGFIMPDRNGKVRYFYVNGSTVDDVVWGDSKEEVYAKCKIDIDRKLARIGGDFDYTNMIKSFVFYQGKLSENRTMLENNPNYIGSVAASGGKMAQAIIEGNFNVDPDSDEKIPIPSTSAQGVFNNNPAVNGDKWITVDLADYGTDNLVALAWDGFHAYDILILSKSTPRENAMAVKTFAFEHGTAESHIIFDATAGRYFNDYIPDAVPYISLNKPFGLYQLTAMTVKDMCYIRLCKMIEEGNLTFDDKLAVQTYTHQNLKYKVTVENEFMEECSVVRFDDMQSGKKRLWNKKKMNQMLGKGRSMDLLDPCAMRMFPCANIEYGNEIQAGYYNHEEETKQAFHAQTEGSIYDEHLWY